MPLWPEYSALLVAVDLQQGGSNYDKAGLLKLMKPKRVDTVTLKCLVVTAVLSNQLNLRSLHVDSITSFSCFQLQVDRLGQNSGQRPSLRAYAPISNKCRMLRVDPSDPKCGCRAGLPLLANSTHGSWCNLTSALPTNFDESAQVRTSWPDLLLYNQSAGLELRDSYHTTIIHHDPDSELNVVFQSF